MANSLVPNKIYNWLAVLWTFTIIVLCLESTNNLPKIKVKEIDKLVHACIHFVFTFLWFLTFINFKLNFKKAILCAFLFSMFFGISLEILQKLLTTTRQADILDVLANVAGAFLAVFLINYLERKNFFEKN